MSYVTTKPAWLAYTGLGDDTAAIAACNAKYEGWDPTTKTCSGCILSCQACRSNQADLCAKQGKGFLSPTLRGPCDCACGTCVDVSGPGSAGSTCIANGGSWYEGIKTCDMHKGGSIAIDDPVVVKRCSGFWNCSSVGAKVAIIGGSVAVVGLITFLAIRK
jgi:hypothetical protein